MENLDLFSDLPTTNGNHKNGSDRLPPDIDYLIDEERKNITGTYESDPDSEGSIGITMFDLPNSEDNVIFVLVPFKNIRKISSQALVEIKGRCEERGGDGRVYRGIVTGGPFHEPDGLRADAPMLVTTAANGAVFIPKYHGRVVVEIIGELQNGVLMPPRFRPLPNSYVFAMDKDQTAQALNVNGDINLGLAIGHDDIEVKIPSKKKDVLPRHMGILGTTGGGKSTTVSQLISEYQKSEMATVIIDTEGEYTTINQPTEDATMISLLEQRKKQPSGVENTVVYHLIGREASNPDHPSLIPFTLEFERLSPYAVMEILDMNEAQQQRYLKAYELSKILLRNLKLFPRDKNEDDTNILIELDEMERGYPVLDVRIMYDVVRACASEVAKELLDENDKLSFKPQSDKLERIDAKKELVKIIKAASSSLPNNVWSWRKVQGQISQFIRLNIFDNLKGKKLDYDSFTIPGRVSIIDLGDTDSPQINNLVIAEILRGVLECQNENYKSRSANKEELNRTMIIIEEAHEFLSTSRIKQMPVLFEQVSRIARRGRKRWLGLTFVTQLPQHLPDEVLGLINSFVLHKISDAGVISRLKRIVGGIDDSLWVRLPNLAPGQALIATPSLKRPLLVAIDPTPCKLRMVD